jgi:hypothetical protein
MRCGLWLLLVLKKRVVEYLVVNINLAHLWLHSLPHFLFQSLGFVCLRCFLSQLTDAGLLNEVWQLERDFMDAAFVLQIAPLLSPVSRHWHRIPNLFALQQEDWVF